MDGLMSFIWPVMLFSLLLVPLLAALYIWWLRRRQQTTTRFNKMGLVQQSAGKRLGWQRHLPPAFFLVGLTMLLFALARPEMIVNLPRVEGTVILAFDVSSSMQADDLEPTRLDAAKAAARVFVENQPSTILIGVVAFGSGGVVVQPPTQDRTAVLNSINRLSTQGGTSLGQGIFSSLSAIAGKNIVVDDTASQENTLQTDDPQEEEEDFPRDESSPGAEADQIGYYPSAVIVLLSDGENTESPDPLQLAQVAAEAGVRIFPVGIGSAEGAVVEIDGFNIVTQLNEASLQQIAGLTNGTYYNAAASETLQEIYETIDLQLTVREEKMEITSIIAGASILLFLAGGALSLVWFGRVP